MVICTNLDYEGSLISYFLEKKYTALKLIRVISGIQLIPYIKFAYHYHAVGSDKTPQYVSKEDSLCWLILFAQKYRFFYFCFVG